LNFNHLKLTHFCCQGSDEESDVDDEEREVEAYDRQLADAEYKPSMHSRFSLRAILLVFARYSRVLKSREERRKKFLGKCIRCFATKPEVLTLF
jgi:hypothetical protein